MKKNIFLISLLCVFYATCFAQSEGFIGFIVENGIPTANSTSSDEEGIEKLNLNLFKFKKNKIIFSVPMTEEYDCLGYQVQIKNTQNEYEKVDFLLCNNTGRYCYKFKNKNIFLNNSIIRIKKIFYKKIKYSVSADIRI